MPFSLSLSISISISISLSLSKRVCRMSIFIYVLFLFKLIFCATKKVRIPLQSLKLHLNAHFQQGVHWYSSNCRVWIHCKTHTWDDNNIQSNAPYKWVLTTQLDHLASLAKWLIVRLRTKWLWVRISLQPLDPQISRRLWARSSLKFRQL